MAIKAPAVFAARLAAATTRICMRYRVTGLAAEAGFFALLSLPPLVLGLVASVGFLGDHLGRDVVSGLRRQVTEIASTFLTADAVQNVILPTFNDVLLDGRFEIVSIGFVMALWSGSRALNVFIDTISIMYGLGGHRGIVRTRALSFSLYLASLVVGAVVIPLVLIGPGVLHDLLETWDVPFDTGVLASMYWPAVSAQAILGLATLYHLATPVRTPWRRDVPGALLALVIWVVSSVVLRRVISESVNGTSIYGPLATPIIVLIWLYFLAIGVLIGAALNAALDEMYPHPQRVAARRTLWAQRGKGPLRAVSESSSSRPSCAPSRFSPSDTDGEGPGDPRCSPGNPSPVPGAVAAPVPGDPRRSPGNPAPVPGPVPAPDPTAGSRRGERPSGVTRTAVAFPGPLRRGAGDVPGGHGGADLRVRGPVPRSR